jgi:hypothetical protein
MKGAQNRGDSGGTRRRISPRIVASPAARRTATLEDIRFGVRWHRGLDSLPFSFTGEKGQKFILATTDDFSLTLMASAKDFAKFTRGYRLRELNEERALG